MIKITMKQRGITAGFTGDTGFAFVLSRTPKGDLRFTQNQAGTWDKHAVCCACEALMRSIAVSNEGKQVFLDGLNMFIYELQDMLKDGDTAPRVKVFVDNTQPQAD